MRFCFNELLLSISYALDCVERDLVGVATHHSKRVALLCVLMGKEMGMSEKQLSDLAACAILHDNALTEYIQAEYLSTGRLLPEVRGKKIGIHCVFGERNVKNFPFFGNMENVILYHHENADGSGPFGRRADQVPAGAALIHLADTLDVVYALRCITPDKYAEFTAFLKENTGKLFAAQEVALFFAAWDASRLAMLADDRVDAALGEELAYFDAEHTPEKLMLLSGIFARIVDYKSTFTSLHSMGIAHKAGIMAAYYHWDDEKRAKLFLAGAFHDIGKLAVDVNILEKPGKLTAAEYAQIQEHAQRSWEILSSVRGFEEISRWAALHHEKLDGSGYPFGYGAAELGFEERLMACLDIYQALREDRPYKKGMTHAETMRILYAMADRGALDSVVIRDIDAVFAEGD